MFKSFLALTKTTILMVYSSCVSEPSESSAPVPGVTGLGYSGFGNAQWERGANLQEYYSKREDQDAKAVGLNFLARFL